MTTELEKQFFDTFGIEHEETITCIIEEDWLNDYHLKTWYPISEWMKNNAPCKGEKECSNECNCYQVKNKYPQITDRQYLELISAQLRVDKLTNVTFAPNNTHTSSIKGLQELILGGSILCYETLLKNNFIESAEDYKHQVQAVFEGER